MNNEFENLDALLRDSAVPAPKAIAPDLRSAVVKEINRRRAEPVWRKAFRWTEDLEPVTGRLAFAALVLAVSVAIGIVVPAQLSNLANKQKVARVAYLQSFAAPAYPWGTNP